MMEAARAVAVDELDSGVECGVTGREFVQTLAYAPPAKRRRFFLFQFPPLDWCLVVGLLALLAAFALPALLPSNCGGSKFAIADASVGPNGSVSQAIDLFHFSMGRYPRSLDELMVIAADDPDRAKWTGPYLKDVQGLMDPWGNPYMYVSPGIHHSESFDLWSIGRNQCNESWDRDGDDGDDVRNWE